MLLLVAAALLQTRMDEPKQLLEKATTSVRNALARAEQDPHRPGYHFRAPALWMNDPNGPIYYKGWYHVFYQFNPYGEQWGDMHWGHARSRDLVKWEHLPIAIPPSKAKGEDHVFSGSTFIAAAGKPKIFYTSIGNRAPEQWIALPTDDNLIGWRKPAANPIVSIKTHAPTVINEWRDPFLFTEEGKTYMLTGGRHEGKGAVAMYRAENSDLTRWSYVGIIFQHPTSNLIECPNIAKLGNRWMLLTSHDGRVDWFTGEFDFKATTFKASKSGVIAEGSYASQLLADKDGKLVHLAWMPTNNRPGWNGYLTLPSELKLTKGGEVARLPISALESLRGKPIKPAVSDGRWTALAGTQFEALLEVSPSGPEKIELSIDAGSESPIKITFDPNTRMLQVPGRTAVKLVDKDLKLRIYVDRSALDLYSSDGLVTRCVSFLPPKPVTGLTLKVPVGAEVKRFSCWPLQSSVEGRFP